MTIFPKAVIRNSWPRIISLTASVCPGFCAGTRFPYPVVVSVVKLKNSTCCMSAGFVSPAKKTVGSWMIEISK